MCFKLENNLKHCMIQVLYFRHFSWNKDNANLVTRTWTILCRLCHIIWQLCLLLTQHSSASCLDKGENQGFPIPNNHPKATCTTWRPLEVLNEDKKCTLRQYVGLLQDSLIQTQWPELRRRIGWMVIRTSDCKTFINVWFYKLVHYHLICVYWTILSNIKLCI